MRQGKRKILTVPSQNDAPEESDLWTAWWRSHMPFQRWQKWLIPMASNRTKTRRWASLTIWNKVKVPPCRYKVMHRKRVTCELHDSYFRSMTITHVILKIADVTHPDSQISEEIAGAWRRVHISTWEFEGNIRPTNWTEDSEKIPLFTKAGRVVTLWALSSAIVYLHRRVQAS